MLFYCLGFVDEPSNNIINMNLLTFRKPLSLPMTLYHRDKPSELRSKSEAIHLLIYIKLIIIVVNSSDFDFLGLLLLGRVLLTSGDAIAGPGTHLLGGLRCIQALDPVKAAGSHVEATTLDKVAVLHRP